ncbi:MAG TPA: nuclear transport factor 2 family protein [Solirubrobacterales bacterium]|jgi:ketosteroid isomerase-like protein|nr:nuclear transport factor 2 family protein [Solirubrobacterales bacterium]
MSQENVELLRRAYEAWNRRDFDSALANSDPDVEWTFTAEARGAAFRSVYRGPQGVREFWDTFIEPWEEVNVEVEEIRDAGDSVLALVVFHARARDGLEIDQPFVHVVTFRGSQVIRFEAFAERELQQALEAAGLPD